MREEYDVKCDSDRRHSVFQHSLICLGLRLPATRSAARYPSAFRAAIRSRHQPLSRPFLRLPFWFRTLCLRLAFRLAFGLAFGLAFRLGFRTTLPAQNRIFGQIHPCDRILYKEESSNPHK